MKRIRLVIGLFFILFLLSGCSSKSGINQINFDKYQTLIDDNKSFAIEIMSSSCSHCESLKPKLESVVDDYKIELYQLDVSKINDDEYDKLKSLIGKVSTPQIIFYVDGEENSSATRIFGDVSTDKLIEKFKENGYISK